uniref:Uncharacterized protein n=1 Tax=Oryza brachyantha TaxID=4533 RepID=J3KUZ8_ORYBR
MVYMEIKRYVSLLISINILRCSCICFTCYVYVYEANDYLSHILFSPFYNGNMEIMKVYRCSSKSISHDSIVVRFPSFADGRFPVIVLCDSGTAGGMGVFPR